MNLNNQQQIVSGYFTDQKRKFPKHQQDCINASNFQVL